VGLVQVFQEVELVDAGGRPVVLCGGGVGIGKRRGDKTL
jgi:hypothetical protein